MTFIAAALFIAPSLASVSLAHADEAICPEAKKAQAAKKVAARLPADRPTFDLPRFDPTRPSPPRMMIMPVIIATPQQPDFQEHVLVPGGSLPIHTFVNPVQIPPY
ncbi:hypothetical protein MAIT1_00100 [Magnetofaba australis IT-1]|uniref:Uncharacterized protein n=2 Tax=Magnetofaba TaxID=1472292 RepID=A0A1Y2K8C7_9PROT|nr:hypothetical protein MAIT1_00100 [Magnetofaba australis IT-1]